MSNLKILKIKNMKKEIIIKKKKKKKKKLGIYLI